MGLVTCEKLRKSLEKSTNINGDRNALYNFNGQKYVTNEPGNGRRGDIVEVIKR